MEKILIIEDDKNLCELIRLHLERNGFIAHVISDFRNVEEEFIKIEPKLVLLDINLPYYDGFYLCRVLRRISNIPIIIISARNSDMEQVTGIELGADDYITKPFSLELLMAKIRSIFRRTNSSTECIPPHKLSIDNLLLNTGNFTLQFMDKHVELSKNEFKLIKKFMENADKVITREELLMELWDDSSFVEDNTLTVNITRVKNILLELGIGDAIKTKKGVGYLLDSSFKLVGDEKNE